MAKRRSPVEQEEKFRIVEAYLKSNQTQKEFGKENGISIYTLQGWIYKYREFHPQKPKTVSGGNFVQLKIKDLPSSTPVDKIEIHYPNGTKLFLPHQTDLSVIKKLTV